MKKVLTLLLALMMALSLVACGSTGDGSGDAADGGDAATEDVNIAVVLKCTTSEYWGYVQEGCEKAAAELGIKVTVTGPNAESDVAQQVNMIETAIGSGCDAIVCAPNDAAAANSALQAAIDKNIPVLAVDTNCGIEGQTSFVGTMNDEAAYQGGIWAASQLSEGAKAVIIYGQEGDNTSNLRKSGYTKACEEKGIEILDALSGQNTTDGAVKTMEDLLNKHGDAIDVVFCHNDDTALGAAKVCAEQGITDIIIVGFDGNASAYQAIASGTSLVKATVAQQPIEMGYQVVKAAYSAIKGEAVEPTIAADVVVVTAENVKDYM